MLEMSNLIYRCIYFFLYMVTLIYERWFGMRDMLMDDCGCLLGPLYI